MSEKKYGYLSYTTHNIGDDIQSIAARQFLPHDAQGIDRDYLSEYKSDAKTKTIMNAWYMQTKNNWISNLPPPAVSWPPSLDIEPFLISIHFTDSFRKLVLTDESIQYLKKFGPIGARDLSTCNFLNSLGVPAYFSSCLTLTLENDQVERDAMIYAVDIDNKSFQYLKRNTNLTIIRLTHTIPKRMAHNQEWRYNHALSLLNRYKRAHCVITTRLHAAMPCLGLETPVLFINTASDQYRFDGLKELVRYCSRHDFLQGNFDFNFDNPEPNSTEYKVFRYELKNKIMEFMNKE